MRITETNVVENVKSYNIVFDNGFEFEILNLGGIITKIITPDKNNNFENIVVGYKDYKSYLENPSYFGAIIGRTSGRICDGIINIDDETFDLSKNYNPHNGHGGTNGFNKKLFDVSVIKDSDKVTFKLETKSLHMEENFPGDLDVYVEFEVKKDFEITQTYYAKTNKKTLVNMTNHTYFNLSGNLKKPVTESSLTLKSDYLLEIDETCVPTGKKIETKNTPFDFLTPKKIGDDIDSENYQIKVGYGYDHTFLINNDDNQVIMTDESGRRLSITTDQKAVVIYSMNFTDDLILYNNKTNQRRFGICFETQAPPIGRDMCFIEDSIVSDIYTQKTTYKIG
ncbi:MAG: aldose epimerase family protein [Peptostreptococcaceae bacterium]